MSTDVSTPAPVGESVDESVARSEELAAQVGLLAEENRHLRREYRRARQVQYRRTALGLLVCGVVAAVAGLPFPDARPVLFSLAGIGLFSATLVYFLTPERIVPATVGERAYTAFGALGTMLRSELGLSSEHIYLPTGRSDTDDFVSVLLFVPQHAEYELPDRSTLDAGFVIADDERRRGISMWPTGAALYREFQSQVDSVPETLEEGSSLLADTVVESFELADSVTAEVDADGANVTFGVDGSAFGSVDRFDHPVASFLGVGLARTLDAPVVVEGVETPEDDRSEYLVRCSVTGTGDDSGPP